MSTYLRRRRWQCPACGSVTSTTPATQAMACGCQSHVVGTSVLSVIMSMTEVTGPADWADGLGLRVVSDKGDVLE